MFTEGLWPPFPLIPSFSLVHSAYLILWTLVVFLLLLCATTQAGKKRLIKVGSSGQKGDLPSTRDVSGQGQPLPQRFSCLGSKARFGVAQLCGLDWALVRKLLKYQEIHKMKLCKMRKVKAQREAVC